MLDEQVYYQQALAAMQQKLWPQAEQCFQEVLRSNPAHIGALANYSKCLEAQERFTEALPLIGHLNASHPESLEFALFYSKILAALDRFQEALIPLKKILDALKVQNLLPPEEVLLQIGELYYQLKDDANAQAYFFWSYSLFPKSVQVLIRLSFFYRQLKVFNKAEDFIKKALKTNPADLRLRLKLGDLLFEQDKGLEALKNYEIVRAREINNPDLHVLCAKVQTHLRLYEQAEKSLKKAIDLNADSVMACFHLGNVYSEIGQFQKALSAFQKVIELQPEFAEAHFNRAQCLFSLGLTKNAFEAYAWRWKIGAYCQGRLKTSLPEWGGVVSDGLQLVILTEQGLGDGVFFTAVLPLFLQNLSRSKKNVNLFYLCDPRLVEIYCHSFPSIQVKAYSQESLLILDAELSDSAAFIAIGDLMAWCWDYYELGDLLDATELAARQGLHFFLPYYLKTPKRESESFHEDQYRPSIGLNWHSIGQRSGSERSIALKSFMPLLKASQDLQWCSLQYGDHKEDIFKLTKKLPKLDFSILEGVDLWSDMNGLAEALIQLDLFITIDNSTAHLAGALGVPTWLLLPPVHNWRWPGKGEKSVWYPSVKIFRWQLGAEKQLMQELTLALQQKFHGTTGKLLESNADAVSLDSHAIEPHSPQ